jgi:prevent-host-death family protein
MNYGHYALMMDDTFRTFSLSELHNSQGDVVDAALREPVRLTKHGKPKLVVMSIDHYEKLTAEPDDPRRALYLHEIPADEAEALAAEIERTLKRLDSGHEE